MYNRLEELHTKYKKHQLKLFLKYLSTFSLVFVALGSVYFYSSSTSPQDKVVDTYVKSERIYAPEVSIEELSLSLNKTPKIATVKRKNKRNKEKNKNIKQHKVVKTVVQPLPKSTYFTSTKNIEDIEIWIAKYHVQKSYTSAIHISKEYYATKMYKEAGIWAKRANQINRDKEEAWLYYAKSVHSLGNLTKAKRILNVYLQYKRSAKAELLLFEWNS